MKKYANEQITRKISKTETPLPAGGGAENPVIIIDVTDIVFLIVIQ